MTKSRIDVSRAASITIVTGSSGSGKSAYTKKRVRRVSRLIVWDPDDEYEAENCQRLTSPKQLVDTLKRATRGRWAYVPSNNNEFDFWARCAFTWTNCTAVGEELADVTNPGKAPPGWGTLVRRGRKYGIDLIGVTQRPSECDKTIIGNANIKHACMMNRAQDRKYMAAELDIPQSELDALMPLEWVERNNGKLTRGKLSF